MDLERYKQRLLTTLGELEERIDREVATARGATDDQSDVGDVADVAQVDEVKEDYFAIADTDTAVLKEVTAALIRIENGTFGRCIIDGKPIEEKRLEAVPWTPYCVEHQKALEESAGKRTPSL